MNIQRSNQKIAIITHAFILICFTGTATSQIIEEFYRQYMTTDISKAKALQNAQKKLIHNKKFEHPIFWAPFLLIGNWM